MELALSTSGIGGMGLVPSGGGGKASVSFSRGAEGEAGLGPPLNLSRGREFGLLLNLEGRHEHSRLFGREGTRGHGPFLEWEGRGVGLNHY